MTETDDRSPSLLDLWLMRHSTLVLVAGLVLGIVGVTVGATARAEGGDGFMEWAFFVPAILLVGFAGRAKSMAKRSRM